MCHCMRSLCILVIYTFGYKNEIYYDVCENVRIFYSVFVHGHNSDHFIEYYYRYISRLECTAELHLRHILYTYAESCHVLVFN